MKITHLKVRKVLGDIDSKEFVKSSEFSEMVNLFKQGINADGKPEKGERKADDDVV